MSVEALLKKIGDLEAAQKRMQAQISATASDKLAAESRALNEVVILAAFSDWR